MALNQKSGVSYKIEGRSITVFDLVGTHMGNNWAVGIPTTGDRGAYILVEVDPAPALNNVLSVLNNDEAAGDLNKVAHVLVSSRVAVRLWLEGALTPEAFNNVEEVTIDTSTFAEKGSPCDAIRLPSVKLGKYGLPMLIMSEFDVGQSTVATLDDMNVVV